jgi:hypothetical protein
MNEILTSRSNKNPFVDNLLKKKITPLPPVGPYTDRDPPHNQRPRRISIPTEMGAEPQILSAEELAKEHESVIVSILEPAREFGFIKSPVQYGQMDKRNNYNFSVLEVKNKQPEFVSVGQHVKFTLVYDPRRSAKYNAPLYKAINVFVLDDD